eukprot:3665757-Rhodomonas_salina.1
MEWPGHSVEGMLMPALLRQLMIPAAVESEALWTHLLQTMVRMSQNWWMIQSQGYWTARRFHLWCA